MNQMGLQGWLALAVVAIGRMTSGSPASDPAVRAPELLDPVRAFAPDTVMDPAGLPRMIRLPAPGSPLVALRLSVPIREGRAEAGSAMILQELGLARARALATYVGAEVEGQRTPWGITYTAVGPLSDLDYLAYLLRAAVADPSTDFVGFTQNRSDLIQTALRRAETPGGRITSQLRAEAAPDAPRLSGTRGSLERLTMADVIDLWRRTHQPDRMTLLVAGDVPPALLLASFREMGAPAAHDPGPNDGPVSEPSRPRTQVLRHWYGEARAADGPMAHPEIAALLIAGQLTASPPGVEAEVQLWETGNRKVIAVVGAAYARQRQDMRGTVQNAIGRTASALTEDGVLRAVAGARSGLLLGARTPMGRVDFVGAHLDATGSELAAVDYVRALEDIDAVSMRAYLAALAERSPARTEVTP